MPHQSLWQCNNFHQPSQGAAGISHPSSQGQEPESQPGPHRKWQSQAGKPPYVCGDNTWQKKTHPDFSGGFTLGEEYERTWIWCTAPYRQKHVFFNLSFRECRVPGGTLPAEPSVARRRGTSWARSKGCSTRLFELPSHSRAAATRDFYQRCVTFLFLILLWNCLK